MTSLHSSAEIKNKLEKIRQEIEEDLKILKPHEASGESHLKDNIWKLTVSSKDL